MLIKYISCDGYLHEEEIISMDLIEDNKPKSFLCARSKDDYFEVEAENIKYIGHETGKEREIMQAIVRMCDMKQQITFSADRCGYSLIIGHPDWTYTPCALPEGTYDQLINDLHDALVDGRGLSWEKVE